ncbi:MAG: beta-lactamase family protein [Verrucomicrobiales bacterium]|jgi:CubicO group peptidase (beta-lactamase class C family)|nr:beta-lactamase family protein [Verrucomicrobiales bacterium]MDB2346416.1 beta-lactamase family protein [Verrucomicrobiales bacterium]MDF1786485.1 serine hydrolase [Verrucomicrobiales bacterium]
MRALLTTIAWITGVGGLAAAPPRDLSSDLDAILKDAEIPALAAAAVSRTELRASGAAGIRRQGKKDSVSLQDKFHLGSCTKPMTATLTAILIEEGLLDWDTTIGEVLGKQIHKCHEDYKNVTVEQLLAHVGGLAKQPPEAAWRQAWDEQGRKKPPTQRLNFLKAILSEAPSYPPGTKTEYSNQGYAVVGTMLETLAKKSWESLLKDRLFTPLGMKSAGFRDPCHARRLDHPWGHDEQGKPVPPNPSRDNPDAIGPGATVHANIIDWAKFAQFHLRRKPDKLLQQAASFDKLNSLLPTSGQHGIGGWLVLDRKDMGGHCLVMNGSNTMWYATLWILQEREIAVVVTTNRGQEEGSSACDKVAGQLIKEFGQE